MNAGEKRRAEADSGDTVMASCLVQERVRWSMGIGVDGASLTEGCALVDCRGAAVGGIGALVDTVGACVVVTLG